MNPVQKCQFDILVYFHEFCEKHQLRYFLCGGTCLGAIRHKGFIPWDDDIDVMMPRPDYEKLCKIGVDEINKKSEKFFLQNYETDPNYPYNFMKIRDNCTVFVETNFKYVNMNQGVWIDIFPVDGLSSNLKKANKQLKRFHRTWMRFYLGYPRLMIRKVRGKHFFIDILCNIAGYLFYFVGGKNGMKRRNDKITMKYSYEDSAYVSSAQDMIKCRMFKKEWFDELIKVPFEGAMLYVPKKYDEYLTASYGDYMQLPPADQQIGHHFTAYENLNMSWKDFRKDYRDWRDFKEK